MFHNSHKKLEQFFKKLYNYTEVLKYYIKIYKREKYKRKEIIAHNETIPELIPTMSGRDIIEVFIKLRSRCTLHSRNETSVSNCGFPLPALASC